LRRSILFWLVLGVLTVGLGHALTFMPALATPALPQTLSVGASPFPIAFVGHLDGVTEDIQVVGSLAYLAGLNSGLQIVDIQNPEHPTLRGNYDTPGQALAVQVLDNLAYVADNFGGVQIIDVSNPDQPTLRGHVNVSSSALHVVDKRVYSVGLGNSIFSIIDVANPTTPVLRGTFPLPDQANAIQVVGNLAFVAMGSYEPFGSPGVFSGIAILDVSNPAQPLLRGSSRTNGNALSVQVVGTLAYVVTSLADLEILDISNPATPLRRGSYTFPNLGGTYDYPQPFDIYVRVNLAFVANRVSMDIIDIHDPTNLTPRGTYWFGSSARARALDVVGELVFVADDGGDPAAVHGLTVLRAVGSQPMSSFLPLVGR
jgi:hypothetical protein